MNLIALSVILFGCQQTFAYLRCQYQLGKKPNDNVVKISFQQENRHQLFKTETKSGAMQKKYITGAYKCFILWQLTFDMSFSK